MKDEIKVGDYVRITNGIIAKIIGYDDDNNLMLDNQQILTKRESKRIKHSSNINELIEEGDYVNGHLVVDLDKNIYNQKLVITEVDGKDGAIRHHYLEKSIKSIVTKEQFKNIEYEL